MAPSRTFSRLYLIEQGPSGEMGAEDEGRGGDARGRNSERERGWSKEGRGGLIRANEISKLSFPIHDKQDTLIHKQVNSNILPHHVH